MLIIALVLAVIGLAALVTAVVTSNEVIAWVCIGASVIGVLLLIVDALRERSRGAGGAESDEADDADEQTAVLAASEPAEDYPDEPTSQFPQAVDDTETTSYPDETAYPDGTAYSDETAYSHETEAFESEPFESTSNGATDTIEPSGASSETDTTAVAVDDEPAADDQSDADDSTKRD